MTLMGVTSLDVESLIGFPHDMDPPQDAMGNWLLCFDWKKNKKSPINSQGITQVFDHIWENGATNHPPAADSLPKLLDHHLKEKITQRFKYMANAYQNRLKVEEEAATQAAAAAEAETENGKWAQVEETAEKQLTTAAMRSRVASVNPFDLYHGNMNHDHLLATGCSCSEENDHTVC